MLRCEQRSAEAIPDAPRKGGEGQHLFFWQRDAWGFRNLLSDVRVKRAPDIPRGGILADEMGLGKTVTTKVCSHSEFNRILV